MAFPLIQSKFIPSFAGVVGFYGFDVGGGEVFVGGAHEGEVRRVEVVYGDVFAGDGRSRARVGHPGLEVDG